MSTSDQNFDALVTRYLDDGLSPAEHTTFTDSLRGHPDRQRTLIDLTLLRRTLVEATRTTAPPEIKIPTESRAPATPHKPDDEAPRVVGMAPPQSAIDNRQSAIRVSLYATAAIVLIAAYSAAVYFHNATPSDIEPRPSHIEHPPLATLIQNTPGSNLTTPGDFIAEGNDYPAGEYTLSGGIAEFMLTNAVNVKLRGETRMVMHNDMNVALTRGSAEFVVPKDATDFSVHLSNGARVVDRGTRFRVRTEPDGAARVVVDSGRVDVFGGPSDSDSGPSILADGDVAFIMSDARVIVVNAKRDAVNNLVVNGGFERPPLPKVADAWRKGIVEPGESFVGWTQIATGGKGHPSFYAHHGEQSYHPGASGQFGGVSQSIKTEPGRTYRLSFWTCAHVAKSDQRLHSVLVRIDEDEHTLVTPAYEPGKWGQWTPHLITFAADHPRTSLTLISPGTPGGVVNIDDVIVVPLNTAPSPSPVSKDPTNSIPKELQDV